MKYSVALSLFFTGLFFLSCKPEPSEQAAVSEPTTEFEYVVDQFADLRLLRYRIPGFDELSTKEKKLVYYLTQAGLAGRDIIWDQNYRHNLEIRHALENIYKNYGGEKADENWQAFEVYLKRVWFSNGIHHHYSNDKIDPGFSPEYLQFLLAETNTELTGAPFDIIFNDSDTKKVNKKQGVDYVASSAVNFYDPGITTAEVQAYYAGVDKGPEGMPVEAGLNSKLVREDGKLVEKVYRVGGLYGPAIEEIVKWLELAVGVAENENQARTLELLVEYYRTGDLNVWDDYAISWVTSTEGNIDWINGFIEVYNDPVGYKGSYESIIQLKDFEMSRQMSVLTENAQWFEDASPLMDEHKKDSVVGVSYKTIIVAGEAGDATPSTPIGVNLPNNNWIRVKHGSKSVSLGNIVNAYNNAGGTDRLKEFAYDEEEIALEIAHGQLADKLHTALHEVVGHASGQLNPGIGQPKETLKNYASTLEEGRADLLALYYLMDPKLQELGLVENIEEVGKAAYDGYIRNGLLLQLIRIELGDDIEEDHMVNRQWVSAWAFEKGTPDNVIEKVTRDGKTFYNINDYQKLRELFGQLLRE
ncbi:MAG: dihydrofolate reductase, partial [Robiginitalea sp.]